MSDTTDEQSQAIRDLARRARRLAEGLSLANRDQLLAHAEELEQQATELEQRSADQDAALPPPPVVQMQVQVQQQQATGPPADPDDSKPKG